MLATQLDPVTASVTIEGGKVIPVYMEDKKALRAVKREGYCYVRDIEAHETVRLEYDPLSEEWVVASDR